MKTVISRVLIFLMLIQLSLPFSNNLQNNNHIDDVIDISYSSQDIGAGIGLPVLFIATLFAEVFSANKEWVGGTDSTWNTAGNWNPSGVPATTDSVILDSNATKNCGLNAAGSVKKFTIKSNFTRTFYQLTNTLTVGSGNFSQAGGTFTGGDKAIVVSGSFTLSNGTFVSTTDTLWIKFINTNRTFTQSGGTFTHNNGTLCFLGQVNSEYTLTVDVNSKLTLKNLIYNGTATNDYNYPIILISSNDTLKVTGTFEIKRSDATLVYMRSDGGVIQMEGDTIKCGPGLGAYGQSELKPGNSTVLLVSGSASPYYVYTGGTLPRLLVNTSGTLYKASTTTDLRADRFEMVAGTFQAPTGNFYIGDSGRAFVVSGGTYTHNDGTLYFYPRCGSNVWGEAKTVTIDVPGSLTLGGLRYGCREALGQEQTYIYINYVISTGDTLKVTKNYTQSRDGTLLGGLFTLGGVVQMQGDTINSSFGNSASNSTYGVGTTVFLVDGAASPKFVHTGGSLSRLIVNNSTGTLSAASGTTTLSVERFTLASGTFSAPTGNFDICDSGTAFTKTGGTFTHNSGTLRFYNYINNWDNNTVRISLSGKLTVGHLTFGCRGTKNDNRVLIYQQTAGDTFQVTGNFNMIRDAGNALGQLKLNNGVIETQGNVTFGFCTATSTCGMLFTGTSGTQTLTVTSAALPSGVWEVKTTGGCSVVLGSNITFPGAFTVNSGTFLQGASYTLTFTGVLTVNGGAFIGGNKSITVNNDFTLSGGAFTSTTDTLAVNGVVYADRSLFTISGGTFTHNSGTLRFNHALQTPDTSFISIGASLGHKLTLGSLDFCGTQFNSATRYFCIITSGDTLEVTRNYSQRGIGAIGTFVMDGVITFKGDTIKVNAGAGGESQGYQGWSAGGTAKILVNGDKAQYYNSTGGYLPGIELNTTDTLRAVSGVTTLRISDFTLTKGGFSAPTDTLVVAGYAGANIGDFKVNGGTFTHHNGIVMLRHSVQGSKSCVVSTSLSSNKITFGSLWFNVVTDGAGGDNTYTISSEDTLLVTRTFKVLSGTCAYENNVNGGIIEAQGDVDLSGGAKGTTSIVFTGSSQQTLTYAGCAMFSGTWEVRKTSGCVVLGSNIIFPGKFRMFSGNFCQGASYNYSAVDSTLVGSGCTFNDTGTGDITLAAPFFNSGTVSINGMGGGCGNGDSIFIRSSVNGTRRNWGGSGIFQIIDVKIRDMSSTPAITAYSSTDSLNNTTNWTIDANCYVPSITNVRPAAAKRTAIVTMNGTGFLAAQGTGQIVIGTIGLGTAQSWSATAIVDTVPVTATFGTNNAIITNTCVGKDTAIFRVTNPGITIP